MKINITVREIFNKGLWMDVCDLIGINEWAVSEGRMSDDDVIELSEDQAHKLGLQPASSGLTMRAADLLICPACHGVGGDCEYCVDGFLAPDASR